MPTEIGIISPWRHPTLDIYIYINIEQIKMYMNMNR